jgi:hypothetical protein
MDGRMDGRMDGSLTVVGREVDDGWTVEKRRSRKPDGTVMEAGRDSHSNWSKTKDLLYFYKPL